MLWIKDKIKWDQLSLVERLEALIFPELDRNASYGVGNKGYRCLVKLR